MMKKVYKAGGIVLNKKGEMLVITSNKGLLTLPKGGIERNETELQAAVREIYEESGLQKIIVVKELGTIVRPGFTSENDLRPSVEKHIKVYLCQTEEQHLKPVDPVIFHAEWITVSNALELLSWPEEKVFVRKNMHELIIQK